MAVGTNNPRGLKKNCKALYWLDLNVFVQTKVSIAEVMSIQDYSTFSINDDYQQRDKSFLCHWYLLALLYLFFLVTCVFQVWWHRALSLYVFFPHSIQQVSFSFSSLSLIIYILDDLPVVFQAAVTTLQITYLHVSQHVFTEGGKKTASHLPTTTLFIFTLPFLMDCIPQ